MRWASAASQMPWARTVQASSPIRLTDSFDAKKRAQIQNAANNTTTARIT